jgi:thiol-disulfide isomerase/thioredoxin
MADRYPEILVTWSKSLFHVAFQKEPFMCRFMRWRLPFVLSLVLLCSCITLTVGDDKDKKDGEQSTNSSELTIGTKAPALDVEHWVQDGNGKFKPVTEFQPGQVYVVEFWATWCGPCRASMPHLVETQEKYEKEVQIVSISDEDLPTVEAFLKKNSPEAPGKTYGELTSAYCLTTDPDKSNYAAYMDAAGQNGIPTAFIVGKDGYVEWIGHPMTMDEPLKAIVEDKWDRETFKQEFAAKQKIDLKLNEVSRALQQRKFKEALSLIDEALGEAPESLAPMLNRYKLMIMLQTGDEGVADHLKKLSADVEDGNALNEMAWMVYQASNGGIKVSDELLTAAVEIAEKAVNASQGQIKGYSLDTLAHLKHKQGDLESAIKFQTEAVELAPEQQLKDYLKQLNDEKEKGKDKDK